MTHIVVGTSSWADPGFVEEWYPPGLPARGRVELTPQLEEAMLAETIAAAEPLEEAGRLSAFLLQLSPSFKPKGHALDELAPLVERVAPRRVAIELRHRGWVEDRRLEETLGWLADHGAAFVCTDSPQGRAVTMMPPVDAVTRDDPAYFRAHGRNVQGYQSGKTVAEQFAWDYGPEELRELKGRAEGLASDAEVVRVMFNNNRGVDAPKAAERMRELLGQVAAT